MTTTDSTDDEEPECDRLKCERTPERTFVGFDGKERSWCKECYERDCGRCRNSYEKDANRSKGLCQECREEIASWSDADEPQDVDRGDGTEEPSVQTTLVESS